MQIIVMVGGHYGQRAGKQIRHKEWLTTRTESKAVKIVPQIGDREHSYISKRVTNGDSKEKSYSNVAWKGIFQIPKIDFNRNIISSGRPLVFNQWHK